MTENNDPMTQQAVPEQVVEPEQVVVVQQPQVRPSLEPLFTMQQLSETLAITNVEAERTLYYTETVERVEVPVSKAELKYNLRPQLISENKILFKNAQDVTFYDRQLRTPPGPRLVLWLLTHGNSQGNKSLNYTGKRLFECAWRRNVQVQIMITQKFDLIVTKDGLENLQYEGKTVDKLPDAVLPRLGAKIDYFGLAVVRQLEKLGILVLNGNESLEISRDKLYTLQTLGSSHFPIPKTMIAKFPLQVDAVEREFAFPMILKRSNGSQGKGVMLIRDVEHLNDIVDMIDTSKPLILQEYISKSHGRDIRVIVVGGKAIGGMMRVAKRGFKSNFHQGGYVKPVKLSPAIEWLAVESARLIGLSVAGVDILIDEDTYKICEINASPGFQGFELATGIDVADKILEFCELRTGLWKKETGGIKKKPVVTIPVEADHIIAVAPPTDSTGSGNGSACTTPRDGTVPPNVFAVVSNNNNKSMPTVSSIGTDLSESGNH